jgi:hypothetical protein
MKKIKIKTPRPAAVATSARKLYRVLHLLVRASATIQALMKDANKPTRRRRAEKWLREFEVGLTDKPLKWF